MPKANRLRSAFTLLELIAVIVLLGITALLGSVSLSGYIDQIMVMHAMNSIARADAKERWVSRQSPTPGRLEIDKSKGQIIGRNAGHRLSLNPNIKLIDVLLPTDYGSNRSSVFYSQSGQSASYAVGIQSRRGATRWIVVIGLTGQIVECQSREQAREWMGLAR